MGAVRETLGSLGYSEVFAPSIARYSEHGSELATESRADHLLRATDALPFVYAIGRSPRRLTSHRKANELTEITYLECWLRGGFEDAVEHLITILSAVHRDAGKAFDREIPRVDFYAQSEVSLCAMVGPKAEDEPRQPDVALNDDGRLVSLDVVSSTAGEIGSVSQLGIGDRMISDEPGDVAYARILSNRAGELSRFGLSVERALMHVTGVADIVECTPFPVTGESPIIASIRP